MNEKSNFVFLLGAGRSGTTLLYKMLSVHRSVAYLSNYQQRYPEWPSLACLQRLPNYFPELKRRSWFQEQGGASFNKRRKWTQFIVPTPAEAEPVYASCGAPLTPAEDFHLLPRVTNCLRERFERTLHASGADVLLSKRTANNRRIPVLKQIFPNAKYIHLVRDGRAVAHSLLQVKWWNDHTLYWTGKTPRQEVAEGANPLELAARNWVEEMHSLERGITLIEESKLLEVQYDELLRPSWSVAAHPAFHGCGSTGRRHVSGNHRIFASQTKAGGMEPQLDRIRIVHGAGSAWRYSAPLGIS